MLEIIRVFTLLLFGMPLLIFGLYGLVILYYNRKSQINQQEESEYELNTGFEPLVSVVIATHNEESMISKRVENLLVSNYPREKLEVIFVDDSEDSTPSIIREYAEKMPNIRLIRSNERLGYSSSMIAGCKAAKGEIAVLGDAGSLFDAGTIPRLVARFRNPNIGVVTGKDMIINRIEEVGKSENLYLTIINFLRTAESNMDSTFWIKGEATAVRKHLINDLETCSETFDTTIGLFVREKGYKVVYDPNIRFYEYAPLTHSDRVKQKTTRAANLIKVLFRFRRMMFERKYGKYGCVVVPANFSMLVVAPVAILAGFVLLLVLTFFDLIFSGIMWSIIGFFLLFLLIFRKDLVITFLEFEYSLLKALHEIVFIKREHDKIERIESTRRVR